MTATAAATYCKDRRFVCCHSAVAVGLRISSKKRVCAGLVPGTLRNVAYRRGQSIGVIVSVEVCGLRRTIIEIRSTHGNVEGRGREGVYLKPCGCRIGCRSVLVLASGRAWIARGHRHGDAFGRRLLPQNLPKPSVVSAFMWFAVAEAQTQDGVGVVVYDIDDCKEEAGSNVCIRCNDQMNLSTFGDRPRPFNIEERFGLRASRDDSRIGAINDNDGGICSPSCGQPKERAEVGNVLLIDIGVADDRDALARSVSSGCPQRSNIVDSRKIGRPDCEKPSRRCELWVNRLNFGVSCRSRVLASNAMRRPCSK